MLLHDDTGDLYDNQPFWDVWLTAAGVTGVDARRGPHFSHAVLAFEAAIDAVGVLATMPVLAADDFAAGRLIAPFDLHVPLASAYYLVCQDSVATRQGSEAARPGKRGAGCEDSRTNRTRRTARIVNLVV